MKDAVALLGSTKWLSCDAATVQQLRGMLSKSETALPPAPSAVTGAGTLASPATTPYTSTTR